jgi:toxin FitB
MIAADSSVLVPALLDAHEFHDVCRESAGVVDAAIGHALLETYAVLTRLPQPYTVAPLEASAAVRSYGANPYVLAGTALIDVIERFGSARIAGGSTYDAVIAATAVRHEVTLLTRDERAAAVYERVGADVMWVDT